MYVRIARFDGGEVDWDRMIEAVRRRITGEDGEETPMDAVRGEVQRALMLVDRDNNRGASVIFAESDDQIRRIDDAMNRMSPPGERGERTAVEIYEVAIDESPGG